MTQQRVSPVSITSVLPATVTLSVQGALGQSANLQEWKDSAGSVLGRVASNAFIYAPSFGAGSGGFVSTDNLVDRAFTGSYLVLSSTNATILTRSATNVGLIIKGAASQSADYFQIQNSAGTVVVRADASNSVSVPFGQISAASGLVGAGTTRLGTAGVTAYANAATSNGIIVRGFASQSADMQQWQTSDGSTRARIDAFGTFQNGTATGFGGWVNVQPVNAADRGIIVRGAVSATGNLQEWQNSAGTAVAAFTPLGILQVPQINSTSSGKAFMQTNGDTNGFLILTNGAANKGLVIRAAGSQTADILQVQDSTNAVLAKVASDGAVTGVSYSTTNAYVTIGEQNTGGSLRLGKQSTTATAPGAGFGRLYFRDGTNANTLKLVVRAGTGGAETTILDNIPIF